MDKYIQKKGEASTTTGEESRGGGEVTVALPSPKERVFKKALLLEGAVDFSEYGH